MFNGFFEADLGTVKSAGTEVARLARDLGDHYGLEMMLPNLGSGALLAGDLEGSGPLLTESLRMAHQVDDRVAPYHLLDALGTHAALRGRARNWWARGSVFWLSYVRRGRRVALTSVTR